MSFLRLTALLVLLASSFVANAGDIQATLSTCAKTALSERVSEQTVVKFQTELPQVAATRNKRLVNKSVAINVADGLGTPLGVVTCKFDSFGKMISATLEPSVIEELAGI